MQNKHLSSLFIILTIFLLVKLLIRFNYISVIPGGHSPTLETIFVEIIFATLLLFYPLIYQLLLKNSIKWVSYLPPAHFFMTAIPLIYFTDFETLLLSAEWVLFLITNPLEELAEVESVRNVIEILLGFSFIIGQLVFIVFLIKSVYTLSIKYL